MSRTGYHSLRVRMLCETFKRPFEAKEVYNLQMDAPEALSLDQVEKAMENARYLRRVRDTEHNQRAKYLFKRQWRTGERIEITCRDTQCGNCGRKIKKGSTIYRPFIMNGGGRSKPYCRNCALAYVALQVERLVNLQYEDYDEGE